MTANNTADIYWQSKIYQGCDAMSEYIFEPEKCMCSGCQEIDAEYMAKHTSYSVQGQHNFTDGQPVVEGKDYEIIYDKGCSRHHYNHPDEKCDGVDTAVPLAPQSEQEQDAEIEEVFKNMNMKKDVFNTCINAAISKAKLSATLLPASEVQDIINQLEKLKK